jgi:hypothetical protein
MKTIESKYGLSKMKDEDALLFLETAVENGSDVKEAIEDLKMIDAIFHMKDLHFATMAHTQRTPKGRFRKNSTLLSAIEGVVDARLNGQFS